MRLTANGSLFWQLWVCGGVPFTDEFYGWGSGGAAPYTYWWTYGDGTPGSHAAMPWHQYNSTGPFAVSLEVNDSAGSHAWSNLTAMAPGPTYGCPVQTPWFDNTLLDVGILAGVVVAVIVTVLAVRRVRRGRTLRGHSESN